MTAAALRAVLIAATRAAFPTWPHAAAVDRVWLWWAATRPDVRPACYPLPTGDLVVQVAA